MILALLLLTQSNQNIGKFQKYLYILEKLIIGDCRQLSILEAANIHQCRSVILVTKNERMNIEAAFAARRLNPQTRLIVRSDKQNLNQLLEENLGNFLG